MLALPQGDNEESKVFSPFTLSENYRKKIEPAGRIFEELVIKSLEINNAELDFEDLVKKNAKDLKIEEDTKIYDWEKEYYENLRSSNKDALFSVEEEKMKIEINKKWLKIKEAYETLLDPERRKKYDSTFEFDDTIPEENGSYNEKNFFKVFGPYFIKNSIWSKNKPIPKLGDMSTPLSKVQMFYQYWYNFESWRDFAVEGEYNLDGIYVIKI